MFSEGFYILHKTENKIKIDYSTSLMPEEVLPREEVQKFWEDSIVKFTDHAQRRYMFGY